MAQVKFYDLELEAFPNLFWSPNTCKTRYALSVKGIPFETEWVGFNNLPSTISAITKTGRRPTVPIIVDEANDNKVIQDSWDIAVYLDKQYPNTPSLFGGNIGVHKFFFDYSTNKLVPVIFKLVVLDIANSIKPDETKEWFRKNREEKFGCTLEQFAGNAEENLATIKQLLAPIRDVLKEYDFMTGEQAGWADVVLASHFTLFNLKPELYETAFLNTFDDDVLRNWWNRMEKYRK